MNTTTAPLALSMNIEHVIKIIKDMKGVPFYLPFITPLLATNAARRALATFEALTND